MPMRRSPQWFLVALLGLVGLAAPVSHRAAAQSALQPGDAVVTQFSGTADEAGRAVIDSAGAVGTFVDLRRPGAAPSGGPWADPSPRPAVTAGQVGQVFGVTLDDADPPNIYLTATSAFGLHRNADNTDWMAGMWGPEAGPGTVWKLDAANDYRPEIFAQLNLDGRANSGAALGNIAFDRWNKQVFVSDLETGMIHRLRLSDGADLGHYDHGVDGRSAFLDVAKGEFQSQPAVPLFQHDGARVADCPSGDFARTPSCWNFADFRRRVWGVAVRRFPATEEVRLYYAVWGSQGFGNAAYADAGDDQRNAVWSVRIEDDGSFGVGSARREFFLSDFFRSPDAIARAGRSHPVSDIAFPAFGDQDVMLLAERGGARNLGLAAEDAFAYPHEARVLRYELMPQGFWRGAGRYDIGFYDRSEAGPPYLRGSAAGGVSFGLGYNDAWEIDPARADAFVWATGDELCSPRAPCLDSGTNEHTNSSQVDGLQGREARPYEAFEPITAFQPYPAPGPITPATGPDRSFMLDLGAENGRGSTAIGDVAVYQPVPAGGAPGEPPAEGLPDVAAPDEAFPPGLPPEQGWDPAPLPPDGWPLPPPSLLETDLGIEKTGPADCQEGVNCVYSVKITNLGVVPYIGPLAVNDTMPVDATLVTASPGWHCDVAGQVVACVTLGNAILNVGTSASLTLTVLLPADVADDHVENCAGIDWFEMGTDDGPGDGNDYICIDTPVTDGFDLGLEKTGPAQCLENSVCRFAVAVTNFGPGEFSGVLGVHDQLPANASLVQALSFGWSCAEAGEEVDCLSPDLTLPAGGTETLWLDVKLPDGIAGDTAENCAAIDWAAMGADDGAADVHVDEDCHTVDVLDGAGFFDLAIEKQGPAHCDEGGDCEYTITVTNLGPDDYTGEVIIRDTPTAGLVYAGVSPGWVCFAAVPNIVCGLGGGPHVLHPGDTRDLTLTIQLPAPAPGNPVQNCASVFWGVPGMPPDDNPGPGGDFGSDNRCVSTFIGAGFDLDIAKTGPAECYEGGLCDYSISLTNHGPNGTLGVLSFTDTLPAGATLEAVSDGGGLCNAGAAGTVRCDTLFFVGFAAGTTHTTTLSVRLPDPVAGDTVTNCAAIDWSLPPAGPMLYSGDDDPTTDGPACVETPVLAADLAPFGGTVCELGETCSLDVRIENRGGRLFKGSAGLKGTLDPAVSITGIEALAPGVVCEVTGNGAYECNADALSLKPGEAVKIKLSVEIPADFPHKRIVHRKEMQWPDTDVKDAKPENDRHTSTITIVQPEAATAPEEPEEETEAEEPPPPPPACVGGSVVRGECVCPKGTERKQTGTNAYACEKLPPPPPPITCAGGTVSRGQCVCPKGTEHKKAGAYAYSCEKLPPPPPPITCAGGKVSRGQCVCPKGTERKKTGTYAYSCEKLAPPPQCDRGWSKIDSGKAKLLRLLGWRIEEVTSGGRTILCGKAPPPPICSGGSLRNGQCVCPKGTERKQTGTNAYRCEKPLPPPPPPLTCTGGKVSHGQCVCPKGTERKQTGTNAFACETASAPPGPSLICIGGKVQRSQCLCPTGTTRKQTAKNAYRCEKASAAQCDKGWTQIDRSKAKALAKKGRKIKPVGNILCARRG